MSTQDAMLLGISMGFFFSQAVEGDCDFRVLKLDGQFTVMHAQCHSNPGQTIPLLSFIL